MEENYIIISMDTEKAIDKIQPPFMIKKKQQQLRNLEIEGNLLNMVNNI